VNEAPPLLIVFAIFSLSKENKVMQIHLYRSSSVRKKKYRSNIIRVYRMRGVLSILREVYESE